MLYFIVYLSTMKNVSNNQTKAKIKNITAMLIYGTIGIFVKNIPLSSGVIAFCRGIIGVCFLFVFISLQGRKIDFKTVKNNIVLLIMSGTFIGFNWILLFEAYNYTTVSVATLCYYMQPVFVTLLSPVVLKEKLTPLKTVAVFISLIGMVFVSGVIQNATLHFSGIKGIAFGIGAAVLYSCVVLLNKHMKNISSYDMTVFQLFFASVTILPYILITEDISAICLSANNIAMLFILGIVHTGIAYALYFDSLKKLKAQTCAIFSYVDPVFAIVLSAVVLDENLDIYGIIGAVLILGAMLLSELYTDKKKA